MRPKLYISGIRDLHDARYCAAVGMDWLGFNLDPSASSFHTAPAVQEISEWLSGPEIVTEYVSAHQELIQEHVSMLHPLRVRIPYAEAKPASSVSGTALIFSCADIVIPPAAFIEWVQASGNYLELSASSAVQAHADPKWCIVRVNTTEELFRFSGFVCVINALVMQPDGSIDYEKCDALLETLPAV